jgi:succinate dehydrogenase/fumarate reductase flavoprotein subunit
VVRGFDRLEELAAAYDLPLEALRATIETYNGYVERGADGDFGKPILSNAKPLAHPPYYAIRLWPKVHHTMGGIQINTQAQVIGLDHQPIPGLYAAGEVTGGVHGACRLGSCAVTECLVIGRIAGRSAATASR